MTPEDRIAACGSVVFRGHITRPPTPYDEVHIADGPAGYYDNRTGLELAQCDFWTCRRDNRYCETSCPPREWTCRSETP